MFNWSVVPDISPSTRNLTAPGTPASVMKSSLEPETLVLLRVIVLTRKAKTVNGSAGAPEQVDGIGCGPAGLDPLRLTITRTRFSPSGRTELTTPSTGLGVLPGDVTAGAAGPANHSLLKLFRLPRFRHHRFRVVS